MAKVFDEINEALQVWVKEQSMFFVATAPRADDGHVNLSPKGPIGSLRVLDGHTVAYLDIVGSGAETIAHLRENGRIVIMLCAFEGPPRIVRFHGRGEVIAASDERFAELAERCAFDEPDVPEYKRSIILVDVTRVGDSCGYGVPLMKFEGLRDHGDRWAKKRLRVDGPDALTDYQRAKNAESLDGLPALDL